VPLADWVGNGLNWFAREAAIGGVKVADVTRALAAAAEMPIDWLKVLLEHVHFNPGHILLLRSSSHTLAVRRV
jgi:hypothetical protein